MGDIATDWIHAGIRTVRTRQEPSPPQSSEQDAKSEQVAERAEQERRLDRDL